MNIQIDFNKYRSLGNVYSSTPADNHSSFVSAEALYKKNITKAHDSINKALTLNKNSVGASILIPTLHFAERGFIKSLTFVVDAFNNDNCILSLTKVEM